MSSPWVCPHCGHSATINERDNITDAVSSTSHSALDGDWGVLVQYIVCPTPTCRKTTVTVFMGTGRVFPPSLVGGGRSSPGGFRFGTTPQPVRLRPPETGRQLDVAVPEPIRADFHEASRVLPISPKAAATLARRALQGMIRDFYSIVRPTLKHEVDAIKEKVDPLVWEAIDAVRRVGNIGAHMESDINLIVDVDPDEADKLLALVDLLSKDWYVAKQRRKQALAEVVALGKDKDAERKGEPPAATENAPK